MLRGPRRRPGALRLGLPAPAAAPARGRGGRRRRRRRAGARAVRPAVPVARPLLRAIETSPACCSSTRSTGPTTSSRRSCSRCSATSRSRSPSWARSGRDAAGGRRSPATGPARCTTRSSAAASTTGWSTRRSSARWRSSGAGCRRRRERLAEQVAARRTGCASAGPAQAAGRRRDPRLGRGAARARRAGARPGHAAAHPRRGAEVPRGPRAGPRRPAGSRGRWPGVTGAGRAEARTADPVAVLVGFARTLRAAGVDGDRTASQSLVAAARHARPGRPRATSTGPAGSRCAPAPTTSPRYDRGLRRLLRRQPPRRGRPAPVRPPMLPARPAADARRPDEGEAATASRRARPRRADRGAAPPGRGRADRGRAAPSCDRLLAVLRAAGSRRAVPASPAVAHRGPVDARRTRPRDAARRRRAGRGSGAARARPAPAGWCCCVDVSGSMSAYADTLLRFAHAAHRRAPGPDRGVHARHPADPGHARAGHRDPERRWPRCPAPSRTGAAGPGWARC